MPGVSPASCVLRFDGQDFGRDRCDAAAGLFRSVVIGCHRDLVADGVVEAR